MLDRISWLIADRVVMAEFSGALSIGDFNDVREQFTALISPKHPYFFYTLYHTSARTGLDWRLTDVMHVRNLGYTHPKLRQLVVIDSNAHPLASIVGRMAVHFQGFSVQITRSQEEALAYLYQIDPTLRTSLPR